jgi:hypothetical protein
MDKERQKEKRVSEGGIWGGGGLQKEGIIFSGFSWICWLRV